MVKRAFPGIAKLLSAVLLIIKIYNRPLYRRLIPKYPVYWKGDPQLRILLPQFWMRIVKPSSKIPPNQVHFEVHPQMSRLDVKQYLEKIYKVPVINVNTEIREGKYIYRDGTKDNGQKEEKGSKAVWKHDDKKFAYVTLEEDQTFTYPKFFKEETPTEKDFRTFTEGKQKMETKELEQWDKRSIPPWFR